MEKRKVIIFVAIALALLVTAMSIGCVKEAEKDEMGVTEGVTEGGEKVVGVVENVSADIKEEGEKITEGVNEGEEKLVGGLENASADVEEEGEKIAVGIKEGEEKLVGGPENASEDIKEGGGNDSVVLM
jgi:hypothetical protein